MAALHIWDRRVVYRHAALLVWKGHDFRRVQSASHRDAHAEPIWPCRRKAARGVALHGGRGSDDAAETGAGLLSGSLGVLSDAAHSGSGSGGRRSNLFLRQCERQAGG